MAINKVVFGNEVKMDLTNDTVSADNLLEGETAHDRSGSAIVGTAKQGHTIQNDSGTALPQELALQFVGVYSEDDSTNGKTKVNIIREMTKAQMDALSTDAKKGVIHTIDEADNPANPVSADEVSYGSGSVADALDGIKSGLVSMTAKAGVGTDVSVTFNNPYPVGTNYSVQLTQQNTGKYAYSDLFLAVISRTNTGFTIQVGSDRSADVAINIAWLAVLVRS